MQEEEPVHMKNTETHTRGDRRTVNNPSKCARSTNKMRHTLSITSDYFGLNLTWATMEWDMNMWSKSPDREGWGMHLSFLKKGNNKLINSTNGCKKNKKTGIFVQRHATRPRQLTLLTAFNKDKILKYNNHLTTLHTIILLIFVIFHTLISMTLQ